MSGDQVSHPARWWGHDGIDLREDEQRERLRRWGAAYGDLFRRLREDPRINPQAQNEDRIENGWFPSPDSELYAAMLGDLRPDRIVEVGGGFSTRVARAAIAWHGLPTRITVIDPEPRVEVSADADEVILRGIEEVRPSDLGLEAGDVLFIDSSHRVRPEWDVAHLYTRVVPTLPVGTVVHVHDVFLPYDYPPMFQDIDFSEQYVLAALLAHSPRYRVLFAARHLAKQEPEMMSDVLGWGPKSHGGSFWFAVAS